MSEAMNLLPTVYATYCDENILIHDYTRQKFDFHTYSNQQSSILIIAFNILFSFATRTVC